MGFLNFSITAWINTSLKPQRLGTVGYCLNTDLPLRWREYTEVPTVKNVFGWVPRCQPWANSQHLAHSDCCHIK